MLEVERAEWGVGEESSQLSGSDFGFGFGFGFEGSDSVVVVVVGESDA